MLRVLERQYSGRCTYTFNSFDIDGSIEGIRRMEQEKRSSVLLVKGHCVLAVAPLYGEQAKYITFVRHPFDLFVSLFYYIRRAPWNRDHEQVKKMKDLREYLDFQVITRKDNTLVRHLSGDIEAMWSPEAGPGMREVDGELFSKAVAWLNAMAHVGITSHFDQSLLLMRKGLGWQHHCYYQVQNRTSSRPSISKDQDLMRSFNDAYSWDLQLFALAKQRFDSEVEQAGAGFDREVAGFQSRNQLLQGLNRVFRFL